MVMTARDAKLAMKLWVLKPTDRLAPPFHFAGVPMLMVVAAESEGRARALAAGNDPSMVPDGFATVDDKRVAVPAHSPWTDMGATSCEELTPTASGVIARDLSA